MATKSSEADTKRSTHDGGAPGPEPLCRCPECGGPDDGYRNVGRAHWFVCRGCGVKWLAGENLFRSWRLETETVWRRNLEVLARYREVG